MHEMHIDHYLSHYNVMLVARHSLVDCPLDMESVAEVTIEPEAFKQVNKLFALGPKHLKIVPSILLDPAKFDLPNAFYNPVTNRHHVVLLSYGARFLSAWTLQRKAAPKFGVVYPTTDEVINQTAKKPVSATYVNTRAKAYKKFRSWAEAHVKIAEENLLTYFLIEEVLKSGTSWLQIKKAWPELAMDIGRVAKERMQGMRPAFPFDELKKNAKRAHNLPPYILQHIRRHKRIAGRVIQETVFLNSLKRDGLVDPTVTRALYDLKTCFGTEVRVGLGSIVIRN